jgi:hypothetical protein
LSLIAALRLQGLSQRAARCGLQKLTPSGWRDLFLGQALPPGSVVRIKPWPEGKKPFLMRLMTRIALLPHKKRR